MTYMAFADYKPLVDQHELHLGVALIVMMPPPTRIHANIKALDSYKPILVKHIISWWSYFLGIV